MMNEHQPGNLADRNKSLGTRAVHAGERSRPEGRWSPVVAPIHASVSYLYPTAQELSAVLGAEEEGYVYHRYGNPTVTTFETAIADLESGEAAHAFASGMAALHAAFLAAGVRAGTTIVAGLDLYGATYSLLNQLFRELGASLVVVDVIDLAAVEQAVRQTKAVAVVAETISNPLLRVPDVAGLAELAHRNGARLVVDNTFATPFLCNPLRHGADFVVHSATKYIAGHGDVMAGIVVTSTERRRRLYELNKLVGGVLGPFEAWLALRGLKTMPLRVERQCATALAMAETLLRDPRVAHVNYPGLPDHPQHALAGRLFERRGYGGVLSFEIAGGDREAAFRFMEALRLCLPATSLGDIYSLVLHPATSSHRSLTPEERARAGISEGLLRLSVGIEDMTDILADVDQALTHAAAPPLNSRRLLQD
jgi:cystathionine beta-lyase/cystathionine gamma-synthase